VLLSLPSAAPPDAAASRFASTSSAATRHPPTGSCVSIGAVATDLDGLLGSVQEALDLARAPRGRGAQGPTLRRGEDRPLMRLVTSMRDDHRMLRHSEVMLAPLIEYDLARWRRPARRVGAMLAHPANRTAAASASHLSRSVFYHGSASSATCSASTSTTERRSRRCISRCSCGAARADSRIFGGRGYLLLTSALAKSKLVALGNDERLNLGAMMTHQHLREHHHDRPRALEGVLLGPRLHHQPAVHRRERRMRRARRERVLHGAHPRVLQHLQRQAGDRPQDPGAGFHRAHPRLAEAVDEILEKGLAAGGSEPRRPVQDLGFMYSRDLDDPDGNNLSFLFMEPAAADMGPELHGRAGSLGTFGFGLTGRAHGHTRRSRFRPYSGAARALERVGDRWALLIVRDLLVGARRYGDLKAGSRASRPTS
jgi:hypothetical protein